MKRRLALVKLPEDGTPGPKHTTETRAMKTLEDSAAGNSFALRWHDSLTVAQHTFAQEYDRLIGFDAADNLDVGPVVKAGLHAGLLRSVVMDCENKRARSFHDQRIDRHPQRVFFSLDGNFHVGVHAWSKFQIGIRQFDFGQHRLGRLIQSVGEPSDFAVEASTGQTIG